ncbi:MAG: aminotransferase class I/II-fold pyridoxal phosphate-dependent enzyme [Planctomycetia bacterium]|nr:aminotransferase class I/II-fold pyridoxal phosphate-dependent enzyme [Planctomycetia bacterium]
MRSHAPLIPPIELSAVYRMRDPDDADAVLSGETPGFAYARDGHPNAEALAEHCRRLHDAERGAVCASGMSALAAAVLALTKSGDHLLVSDQLYGKSIRLLAGECARFGVCATMVDTSCLDKVAAALVARPKLLVIETISNPLLHVADIAELAKLAHAHGTLLLVDNTFATPALCQPLKWGADLVLESLTKMMNGHSDVVLGFLGGAEEKWERVPPAISTWGLAASPFDCWLALRGLGTLEVRMERASANALAVAALLTKQPGVREVFYPGLPSSAEHALARQYLSGGFGSMVTFTLAGGRPAATAFIQALANSIPFAPSLGDLSTTLSHPESTSHRGLAPTERARLGIDGGTIRLSVGIEPTEKVIDAITAAFALV